MTNNSGKIVFVLGVGSTRCRWYRWYGNSFPGAGKLDMYLSPLTHGKLLSVCYPPHPTSQEHKKKRAEILACHHWGFTTNGLYYSSCSCFFVCTLFSYCKVWQNFLKMKCQRENILDFVAMCYTQLCSCSRKAAREYTETNEHCYVQIKLFRDNEFWI